MTDAPRVRTLAAETVVYGLAGTLSRFIGVFLVPLYTAAFSPTEYGGIALVTAGVGLLTTFSVLGLDNASARWYYDSDDPRRRRSVVATWLWTQLAVATTIAVVATVAAPQVAERVFGSASQAAVVVLAAWTVPLWALSKVTGNWLRYERRPWTTAAFLGLGAIATIAFVLWFVLVARRGVPGVFAGQLVAGALVAAIAVVVGRSWIAPVHASRRLLREMLAFGLPLVPAAVASWVTASSDRFIVEHFHGRPEVAVYAVAVAVASLVALVVGAFQLAWGPFAFSILGHEDAERVYSRVLTAYAFAVGWLCTVVSLFATEIVSLLPNAAAHDYVRAGTAVPWLAFAQLAAGATYIAVLGPSIAKRSTSMAAAIFVGAVVNLALNLALVPPLGMVGAAVATLAAYATAATLMFALGQRLHPVPYRFREVCVVLAFAAAIVTCGRVWAPGSTPAALAARGLLALAFLPLGAALGLTPLEGVGRLLRAARGTRRA